MRALTFVLLLLLAVAGPARGQAGDPEAGHALAQSLCADCHAVDAGELQSTNPDSPPFQAIAKKPEMTALALTVFFQTPHPSMPNLVVAGDDARNLIAYIQSLKP